MEHQTKYPDLSELMEELVILYYSRIYYSYSYIDVIIYRMGIYVGSFNR